MSACLKFHLILHRACLILHKKRRERGRTVGLLTLPRCFALIFAFVCPHHYPFLLEILNFLLCWPQSAHSRLYDSVFGHSYIHALIYHTGLAGFSCTRFALLLPILSCIGLVTTAVLLRRFDLRYICKTLPSWRELVRHLTPSSYPMGMST